MTQTMNLPNIISLARLLSVPLIVSLILSHQLMAAFILFTIAGLSDALDGFLARIFKARTTLGAYLDPLADKALLVGVFAALGQIGLIELWVVILVVFRDVLIIGGILLLFLFKSTIEMKPLMISKINTVVQLVYALFVLGQGEFFLGIPDLNLYFGYFVALTTVLSGVSYVRLGLKYFNKMDTANL
ncbi:MAG TPA: CDP-alcohol phosphatidyltransferase family protein [Alphaproteobacteria bacterium]|nr:CDP-alcohol phosphatidyltransferase family protein [Alphaproteobacteria bacterium]